jgi:ABC-type amino acid transport substrate-binding protein
MSNKIFVFCIFLFLSINSFFISVAHGDINDIIQKGYISVAMYNNDCFPFFFHDRKGKLTGFDVDVATEIANSLGVKLRISREARTFDSLVEILVQKKADIVVSWFSRTLERAKHIVFSEPYFVDTQCLLVNRLKEARCLHEKTRQISFYSYLNRKDVVAGSVKGTSYVNFLNQILPESRKFLYSDWSQCYNDVVSGRITAGLWTQVGILNLLDSNPEHRIKVKMIKLPFKDFIAIGVNPHDSQLLYWINVFLNMKKYHYSAEELIKKYGKF